MPGQGMEVGGLIPGWLVCSHQVLPSPLTSPQQSTGPLALLMSPVTAGTELLLRRCSSRFDPDGTDEPGTSQSCVVAAGTLRGFCCTGTVGLAKTLGTAASDHNPTAALSNPIPVSAALGEEAVGEQQGPLQRTAEALLLPLTHAGVQFGRRES